MVKAENSWPFHMYTTDQSSNFNCMSKALDPGQSKLPAGIQPGINGFSPNTLMPKFGTRGIPNVMVQGGNEVCQLPQTLYPPFPILYPDANQCPKENLPVFSPALGSGAAPNMLSECQRRFLIFDQTGNETRLLYNSSLPATVRPNLAATEGINYHYISFQEDAVKRDQSNQIKLTMHEGLGENHLSEEESEMHEDTEELNALLYSDDDYSEDDDNEDEDEDEDELTSTGHSPFLITDNYGIKEDHERLVNNVGTSEVQNKRLKLLDGQYKSPTLLDTASSVKVDEHCSHGDSAESNYAKGQTLEEEMVSTSGNEQTKKDELRATLDILESIIPGAKDGDPLSILDSAINYLKSLKLEAESLGLNYY